MNSKPILEIEGDFTPSSWPKLLWHLWIRPIAFMESGFFDGVSLLTVGAYQLAFPQTLPRCCWLAAVGTQLLPGGDVGTSSPVLGAKIRVLNHAHRGKWQGIGETWKFSVSSHQAFICVLLRLLHLWGLTCKVCGWPTGPCYSVTFTYQLSAAVQMNSKKLIVSIVLI